MKNNAGFALAIIVTVLFFVAPVLAASTDLTGTVRDFKFYDGTAPTNPDFKNAVVDDRGIVQTILGADSKL